MNVVTGFLWYFLFLHVFTVAELPADYYPKKEKQVKIMAAEILKLDGARCDLAANCSSTTCSRHACTPIDGFNDHTKYNFTCQQQNERNDYCSSSTGTCNYRQVNYAMSYVRMAPTPTSNTSISPIPEEMCSTICMTRDFTSTMKALASENDHPNEVDELFYFGSIDGVARFYPGEELNDQRNCYSYDPRTRLWYNGAISLQTYVIVLIDNSNFANRQTKSPLLNTALEDAREIVKKLINTPSADDMLDVIAFNETNATPATENPVSIQDVSQLGEFRDGRKNLPQWIDGIPKANDSSVEYLEGGFKQAISNALRRMNDSRSILNKVMLVFTNGQFASSFQLADRQPVSAMLKSNFTKLFIYSFESSPNLQALAKESDGYYYETIGDNFDNPLYQISSFFNFMALARNVSGNEPHWTKFYSDAEGRGNITTVSYQALSQEGHLVGVVAIDIIFKSEQENLPRKAGSRPNNAIPDVHTEVKPTNNTCPDCNVKEAICARSTKKTFRDLECCESCNPESHKWSVGKKVAAIGVPLLVVLALIIAVAWWASRRRKRCRIPKPSTTDLGPYE